MDEYCAKSQEIVNRCRNKLEALDNKLGAQRATLHSLRRMAKDLTPLMGGVKGPGDLPPEFQKALNDTLREIDSITASMKPSAANVAKNKAPHRHRMV